MSSRPWPSSASFSTVHEPISRIERRRSHAGSCSSRSIRPAATSRATLIIASARFGARSHAASSAGAQPASASAVGASRQRRSALRRPQRRDQPALDLAGAAPLDQLLGDRERERLERLRLALGPDHRPAPDHRADQRVAAEALVELGEVLVEPAEERHPLDAVERRLAGGRIGGHADSARRGPGARDRRAGRGSARAARGRHRGAAAARSGDARGSRYGPGGTKSR